MKSLLRKRIENFFHVKYLYDEDLKAAHIKEKEKEKKKKEKKKKDKEDVKSGCHCDNPDLHYAAKKDCIDMFEEFADDKDLQIIDFHMSTSMVHTDHSLTHFTARDPGYCIDMDIRSVSLKFIVFNVCHKIDGENETIYVKIPIGNIIFRRTVYGRDDNRENSIHWEKMACLNCKTCDGWKPIMKDRYFSDTFFKISPIGSYETMCQEAFNAAVKRVKDFKNKEINERLELEKQKRRLEERKNLALEICGEEE